MKLLNNAVVRFLHCAIGGVIGGMIMFFVSGYSLEAIVRLTGYQGDTGSCILIALCFYCPCGVLLGAITPFIADAYEQASGAEHWNDGRYVGLFALLSWVVLIVFSAVTAHNTSWTLPISMWPVALWAAWCMHSGCAPQTSR